MVWSCQVFTAHRPCVQESIDSCCFVLKMVGFCRASENGDEYGIKLEITLLTRALFASVCCLPNTPSYSKSFEHRPSLGTSMIRSLPSLGQIQQTVITQYFYPKLNLNSYITYHDVLLCRYSWARLE
jgi:hypothetical protein